MLMRSYEVTVASANELIDTESRIPDFMTYILRRTGLPVRDLLCILVVQHQAPDLEPLTLPRFSRLSHTS